MADSHASDPPPGRAKQPTLREHPRYKVEWHTSLNCRDWQAAEQVAISNVSHGGMFLKTRRPLEIGAHVEVTLKLPDEMSPITLHAVVRHLVTEEGAARAGRPPGVGVEVSKSQRAELAALVEIARLRQGDRPLASMDDASESPRAVAARRPALPRGEAADIIGLDFGVSYSGVSLAVGDAVRMVPDEHGRLVFPSLVGYPEAGEPVVGWDARRLQMSRPDRAVSSIKRLLGRSFSDRTVAGYLASIPFPTRQGPNDSILLDVDGAPYAVPQVCALIIQQMRRIAEAHLGEPVRKAVINAPVAFGAPQRAALVRAAQLAGLEPVGVIVEPVAGAAAYGFGRGKNEIVAVYDFGGGTFDFTVLDLTGDSHRVLVTMGDSWLGGDDFDLALAEAVANAFWRHTQIELRKRAVDWQRLLLACERAKRQLSAAATAAVSVPGIVERPQRMDLKQPIDRPTFKRVCGALFERSLDVCRLALAQIHLEPRDVTELVITGGTTRIPFVRQGLEALFEREIVELVNPDEAIALGAGLEAARIAGHGATRAVSSPTSS